MPYSTSNGILHIAGVWKYLMNEWMSEQMISEWNKVEKWEVNSK